MSDKKIIQFVVCQLDAGLAQVDHGSKERLKRARQFALSRQKKVGATRLAGLAGVFHVDFFARRALISTFALLLLTISLGYWHANTYIVELAELDSAILTDEMPIDVITDKGFDAWLTSSANH